MSYIREILATEHDNCFLETISLTTDCTNTWNLAPRSFVEESLSSHLSDENAHAELFGKLVTDVERFYELSGYGHITAIKDIYGNEIRCDGFTKSAYGALSGYIVIASSRVDEFDMYCSSVYEFINGAKALASGKMKELHAGENIHISEDCVISKTDTVFTLTAATETVSGGIYKPTEKPIAGSDRTVENKGIFYELSKKQNTITVDDYILLNGNTLSLKFGVISDDILSFAVSGGAIYEELSKKSGLLSFGKGLYCVNDSVSVVVSDSIKKGDAATVTSDAIYEELSKKNGLLSFTEPIVLSGNKVTLSIGGDVEFPCSGGELFSILSTIKKGVSSRANKIISGNQSIGADESSENTEIVINYCDISEGSALAVSSDDIFDELAAKQNALSSDSTRSGIISSYDGMLRIRKIPFIQSESSPYSNFASLSSGELFELFSAYKYFDFTNGVLKLSMTTPSSYGATFVENSFSTSSTNTVSNSSIYSEIEKLNETLKFDKTLTVTRKPDNDLPWELAITLSPSIATDSKYAVSSGVLHTAFSFTQLSLREGSHIHITNGVISNDLETNKPIASKESDKTGLWKTTTTSLTGSEVDDEFKDYASVSKPIFTALSTKDDAYTIDLTEFDEDDFNNDMLTLKSFYDGVSTEFPSRTVNGATIFSVLTGKQNNIRFDAEHGFSVDGTSISLKHVGLSPVTDSFTVSAGAIYEVLRGKTQKIVPSSPFAIQNYSASIIKANSISDNGLPVTCRILNDALAKKNGIVVFESPISIDTITNDVNILSGECVDGNQNVIFGKTAYAELAKKQKSIQNGKNINISVNSTISKTDTVYTLPTATIYSSGGVNIASTISAAESGIAKSGLIFEEFSKKQNCLRVNTNDFYLYNPSNPTIGLNFGNVINKLYSPARCGDVSELIEGLQDTLTVKGGETSLEIYRDSDTNHLTVSSQGLHYTPFLADETRTGTVCSHVNATIVSSSRYVLKSNDIYLALSSLPSMSSDGDFITHTFANGLDTYGIRFYEDGDSNEDRLYSGSRLKRIFSELQDVVYFSSKIGDDQDTENFVVTPIAESVPTSSVGLIVDSEITSGSKHQVRSNEIYRMSIDLLPYELSNDNDTSYAAISTRNRHGYSIRNDRHMTFFVPPLENGYVRDFVINRSVPSAPSGGNAYEWYFVDTDKETPLTTYADTKTGDSNYGFVKFIEDDGKFYAWDSDIGIILSENGETWDGTGYSDTSKEVNNLFKLGTYYIIALSGTNGAKYATSMGVDATWSTLAALTSYSINDMMQSKGTYYVATGNTILSSTNVTAWGKVTSVGDGAGIFSMHENYAGRIVYGKVGLGIYYTDDNFKTVTQSNITNTTFTKIVYGNDRFVAMNTIGEVYMSIDGKTWNKTYEFGIGLDNTYPEYVCGTYGYGKFMLAAVFAANNSMEVIESYTADSAESWKLILKRGTSDDTINYTYDTIQYDEDFIVNGSVHLNLNSDGDIYSSFSNSKAIYDTLISESKCFVSTNSDGDVFFCYESDSEPTGSNKFIVEGITKDSGQSASLTINGVSTTSEQYDINVTLIRNPNPKRRVFRYETFPYFILSMAYGRHNFVCTCKYESKSTADQNRSALFFFDDNMLNYSYQGDDFLETPIVKKSGTQMFQYSFSEFSKGEFVVTRRPLITVIDKADALHRIIEGSIQNFSDNEITTVGEYTFAECELLSNVSIPNATSVYSFAFMNVGAFTSDGCTISMDSVTSIGASAFYGAHSRMSSFESCTSITASSFYDFYVSDLFIDNATSFQTNSFKNLKGYSIDENTNIYVRTTTMAALTAKSGFPWGISSDMLEKVIFHCSDGKIRADKVIV